MLRVICAILGMMSISLSAHAQPKSAEATNFMVSEAALKEQADWFVSMALGRGVVNQPQLIEAMFQKSSMYQLAIPKFFSDIERWRPSLVWLPTYYLGNNREGMARIADAAKDPRNENCQRFNKELLNCIAYVPIRSVSRLFDLEPAGEGVAVCNRFVNADSKNRTEQFDLDCEPLTMRFKETQYVRVVATLPTAFPPLVPGFKDKAIVFQYQFRSTDVAAVQSPRRVAEFLDGLAQASGMPPLTLAVDRGDADNVIVARSEPRFSSDLKLWEKVRLQLTTKSQTRARPGSNDELEITVTGRLYVLLSNDNSGNEGKWFAPADSQNEKYERMVATNVINSSKAICEQYSQTIGRAGFSYNAGPIVSIKCEHPAP